MRNRGLAALARRFVQVSGLRGTVLKAMPGMLFGLGLAACAHPAPVVMAPPPPPPVGHPYKTLVEIPPPAVRTYYVRHMTLVQEQQLQQAFNIVGLKSALMVAALSCGQQDRYDAFMTAHQPHVLAAQHVVDQYFRRTSWRAGQANEDNFVTLLANNQSVSGLGQGATFCLNNTAEFNQVLALKTDDALDSFVTDQSPDPQAMQFAATPVVAPYHPLYRHHLKTSHQLTAAVKSSHAVAAKAQPPAHLAAAAAVNPVHLAADSPQ